MLPEPQWNGMKKQNDELKAVIINGDNENKDDIDKLIKAFAKSLKQNTKINMQERHL